MPDAFAAFAELERWVVWRPERHGPNGRATKVPYDAHNGRRASSTDPVTWAARAVAGEALKRLVNGGDGGLGIVLGDIGDETFLAGTDLDTCIDDGLVADWAAAVLAAVRSYCELSPSGNGLKTYFLIAAEDVRWFLDKIGVRPDQWGCRRNVGPNSADHGSAIEFYCRHRYFAVTGQHWAQSPERVMLLDHGALAELASLIPPPSSGIDATRFIGGDQSRSGKAFGVACRIKAAGGSKDDLVAALEADPELASWLREKGETHNWRELNRLWQNAPEPGEGGNPGGVNITDFFAYMPQHAYIYSPARELWPMASVNARLPPVATGKTDEKTGKPKHIPASIWLDRHQPVEQTTWAPGEAMIIQDRLISEGGWIERHGVHVFNLYRSPLLVAGDATQAGRWIEHVRKVYPDDAAHIIRWFGHRVQYPADKLNHALVLGGLQGIGKDTLIEPVKRAVGPWNVAEPSPTQLMGRFNGFAKSVILRVSEARDLGDVDRYAFYEHLKVYAAAPPDVLRIDEKNLREYNIVNCCAVLITTNHKTDGIYLPADDRRHYVAWSILIKTDFEDDYWDELWRWYDDGGDRHVAAYLAELDLADFNPKAPPPKTEAFWTIVNAGRSPEDAELADCLDHLNNPNAVTMASVLRAAEKLFPPPITGFGVPAPKSDSFADWLKDRRNRRTIPHRFEACGYAPVRNPGAEDGLWVISGKRMAVYARSNLTVRDQIAAAQALALSEISEVSENRTCLHVRADRLFGLGSDDQEARRRTRKGR